MKTPMLTFAIASFLAVCGFCQERSGIIANRCDYTPIYFDFSELPGYCDVDNGGCIKWKTDSTDVWNYRLIFSPWSGNKMHDMGAFSGDLFSTEFKNVLAGEGGTEIPVLTGHLYAVGMGAGRALIHVVAGNGGCVNWMFYWRYNASGNYFPGSPLSLYNPVIGRPTIRFRYDVRDVLGREPADK